MELTDTAVLVLSSLADGSKHGYALARDIEQFAGVRLGPGSLYGALSRLEDRGLIEALPASDRRRPYQLTSSGATTLQTHLTANRDIARIGLRRLAGGHA
ncbi:MAG: PadR family transcriptional regulator [Nocardioidaceae bacterium]